MKYKLFAKINLVFQIQVLNREQIFVTPPISPYLFPTHNGLLCLCELGEFFASAWNEDGKEEIPNKQLAV